MFIPPVGNASGVASQLARQLRRLSDLWGHGWAHQEADPEASLQVSPERRLTLADREWRKKDDGGIQLSDTR